MVDHAENSVQHRTITLAGACFWCLGAVYLRVAGVHGVQSGCANRPLNAPSYEQVCRGDTGHAEADAPLGGGVVTELAPRAPFWPAQAEHDRYVERHPWQGDCAFVVGPKVATFQQRFVSLLRP